MKTFQLLQEQIEDFEVITETQGDKKSYYIEGIFLQGNIKNKNGRIYPEDVLDEAVEKYDSEYIQKRRAFGELNHPSSPELNLDRVSHYITELKKDKANYIGKSKIMTETPHGKIVKAFIDENLTLGVSSRGMGSITEKSNGKFVDTFIIATGADIVANPSAPDAFVSNLMENASWIYDAVSGSWIKTSQNQIHSNYSKRMSKTDKQNLFLEQFESFLQEMNKYK